MLGAITAGHTEEQAELARIGGGEMEVAIAELALIVGEMEVAIAWSTSS